MGRLSGKVAIVTGGASGFGAGIVAAFEAEGAQVLVADLAAKPGYIQADVSQRSSWEAIKAAIIERFDGQLDCVVLNAGTTYNAKSSLDVTENEFDRVFDVNVKSFFHATQILLPLLIERGQGGSFVTISSTAALRPRPNLTWYNATKGAVSIASKSLAVEMAPHQIRFNTVCPVAGATPLLRSFAGGELTAEKRAQFVASIPLGRLSEPSDVAAAVVFLAEQTFITGIDLEVDGGRCI